MSIYLPTDFCFTKVIYKREDCDFKTGEIPDAFTAQGLKEAREILRVDALSEEERKSYRRYLESVRLALSLDDSSRYEGYCDGHIAGRAEGRAEGRADAMREIARSLKAAGKLSIEEIAEITKLPLEEIEKL